MKENIDNLYNRKLKGLETRPPEEVWQNIASRLPQNKAKRRVLPLWYKLGGIAAAIALLAVLGNAFYSPVGEPETRVVIEDPSEEIRKEIKTEIENIDGVNEKALSSSSLPESLIHENNNQQKPNPNPNRDASSFSSGKSYFTEIPGQSEVSLVPERFSFSEFNDFAFQEEMQEQLQNRMENKSKTDEIALPDNVGNELDEEKEESLKLWNKLSISPLAAVVYYDNMGSGNSIDNGFENNTSAGDISMGYGIQLGLQLTKKLKVRSGVNKVDLSYNTREVNFSSALNATAFGGSGSLENSAGSANMLSNSVTGNLNQRMGFIEVPLEFEYALSNKKFGVNIIAGGSTLFLDENMVTLSSAQFSTNLGQAQNINTVSYSANIGLGLNYKLSPRLLWNLEPVFKYQLNTFRNTEGVNPYFLGLYSGLNFKF